MRYEANYLENYGNLLFLKNSVCPFFLHCIEVLHETNYSKGNGVLKTLHHLETSYIIPFCIYMANIFKVLLTNLPL